MKNIGSWVRWSVLLVVLILKTNWIQDPVLDIKQKVNDIWWQNRDHSRELDRLNDWSKKLVSIQDSFGKLSECRYDQIINLQKRVIELEAENQDLLRYFIVISPE